MELSMGVSLLEGEFVQCNPLEYHTPQRYYNTSCCLCLNSNKSRGGSLFQFYRERYNCQVDVYGVWGDEDDDPRYVHIISCICAYGKSPESLKFSAPAEQNQALV